MELKIIGNQTVKEIQENFNRQFPYLKLAFYRLNERIGPGSQVDERYVIGSVRNPDGVVEVAGSMKVMDVEKKIKELFGIHAEVFRQSGKLWLQTSSTDHWTLKEQNEEGRESIKDRNEKPEDRDYHEQE